MRKTVTAIVLLIGLALCAAVQAAPLPPGTSLTNPDLGGGTNFTIGKPAWFVAGNILPGGTLDSPYVGAFEGNIVSTVYQDPGTGNLGFMYNWNNTTGTPTLDLIRSTIGGVGFPWLSYNIIDAGSDESGSSTDGGGSPTWTDGDPAFLLRDPFMSGAGLTVQWRTVSEGTVIRNPSDFSADVWFVTDADDFQVGTVGILDTGQVSDAEALVPMVGTAVIPEPVTMLGLMAGVSGLVGYMRRRRNA